MICKMHAKYSLIDDVLIFENQNVTLIWTEPGGNKEEISLSQSDKKLNIV